MPGFGKRNPCLACGSQQTVPIVYGTPGVKMIEQVERGEIVLGGCLVGPDQPDRHCQGCGQRWDSKDPNSASESPGSGAE